MTVDTVTALWRTLGARRQLLVREFVSFGLVGATGFVVDVGLFNFFFADGQIVAKCISTTAAMVVTYLGNRYLAFAHRAGPDIARETVRFAGINVLVLLASLAVIGMVEYPLHLKGHLVVMNVVNVATIGVGTLVRFHYYRHFVFRYPSGPDSGSGSGPPDQAW